ncbi:MazG family protein [Geodermatophilus sabuli]|uniref:XTP/dITP diphosphohydrolase n=1 Tax=Geodermatophilus sabuli TaxID=1564158 RepID=A0A285EGU3_9ACTN|nr:MazG family protein [Geodermatophilus sabuli]MBB3083212.1 XTP/dITP diphosphohydrolase [Geodermatophilus sabuli]SNX98207.1 XTP/dITP diphosphohydrolase [Geodermatophilus sabuli]
MPVALAVTVSPSLPGLLGPAGWRALAGERPIVALPGAAATAAALRAAGWVVEDLPDAGAAAARPDEVVALVSGERVEAAELVDGAPVPSGARLLDVVAVMDRLRSPGGCPWDAEQTHASLRGYLLEEAHEAYDAIVDDDAAAMREELGDVLLQVVFHARVAAEAGADRRFTIDEVAGDLVDKLVRRHPHVFGDAGPRDVAEVEAGWEEIKKAEKQRRSPTEGVSRSQPAAAWGAALVRRAARAGLPVPEPAELSTRSPEELGERLLAVVSGAAQRGWDVEDALREAVRRYAGELDAAAEARAGS